MTSNLILCHHGKNIFCYSQLNFPPHECDKTLITVFETAVSDCEVKAFEHNYRFLLLRYTFAMSTDNHFDEYVIFRAMTLAMQFLIFLSLTQYE